MNDPLQIFKILIIEDSPTALEIIQEGLSTSPFPVFFSVCKTMADADQYLKSCFTFVDGMTQTETEGMPDYIVLDMELPDGNGLEVLANIRNEPRFKDVPILINTSSPKIEYMFKSKAYDNVSFLKKAAGNGDAIREMVVKYKNRVN